MDPWSTDPLHGPGGPFPSRGTDPWTPIFTTTHKQTLLVCLIAGSYLHLTLPALSFMSNMANVDESKHCCFYH